MANRELYQQIEAIYHENHGVYGSPRIYHELKSRNVACSENRVARLMRLNDLQAKQARRFKATTKRNQRHKASPNLLKRAFIAKSPDEKWLADITYISTLEGWLYLAVIMDMFSRRVVGWSMSDRMRSDLTVTALQMALQTRGVNIGLIHHSDQGSQYTDSGYQDLLKDHGIRSSMNGVGTWYDNAPMESFFGTLKTEWTHHQHYRTRQEARTAIFYYIESFYNRRRRHSGLNYISPEAYEEMFYQQHLAVA